MNYRTIAFWVLVAALAIATLSLLKRHSESKLTTQQLTKDALFIAIILLMSFVPQLGFITVVPGLSLTLLPIPVLLGAYLFGWKRGLLYGTAFGIASWIQASVQGVGFNLLFVYPWVSVLPRLIWGFLAGLVFELLKKTPKIYTNGFALGAICFVLTCLHTCLVFLDLWMFYPALIQSYFTSTEPAVAGLAYTFLGLVALGMVGEATLSAVIVPVAGRNLYRIAERKD
jgi:uncharacterized membrane protein